MNQYFKNIILASLFGLSGFMLIRLSLHIGVEQQRWGLGSILAFVSFLMPVFFLRHIRQNRILYTFMIVGLLIAVYLRVPSVKFFYKILPLVLSAFLGYVAGLGMLSVKSRSRYLWPSILFIFPLILALNIYSLWVHKIEFGNYFGEVEKVETISFAFTNKEGKVLTNETEKGKVVLFDFWFIGCPPCWVKFPALEALYKKYENDPRVAIYAVNRPMKQDKPGRLFSAIEEKGYHFRVLAGTQEGMDAFGVYVYPTVVLLSPKGEVVYIGEIEKVEEQIETILKK